MTSTIHTCTVALQEAEKQKVTFTNRIGNSTVTLNVYCMQGKKARSIAEMRNVLARKKQKITHGLPEWGKDLPEDVGTEIELNMVQ